MPGVSMAIRNGVIAGLIALLLVIFFIKNIISQSRFTVIEKKRNCDTKEILDLGHKLNWKGNTDKVNNTVELLTERAFFQQRITIIILDDHRLLFNSYSLSELVLFDKNKDNLKSL